MITVPMLNTAEDVERACHTIQFRPPPHRKAWAEAILAAVTRLVWAKAIDQESAGRYRQIAGWHRMEAERWEQLHQNQSELTDTTSDTTPLDDSGSATDDLGSSTEKIETVEPSTTPTSSNPTQTIPSSSSSLLPDQPSTPTTTHQGKGRSKRGGPGSNGAAGT